MKTEVVNIKVTPEYDVYIGRPSKWGNPFKIGRDGTREEVIAKYRDWVLSSSDERASWIRENVWRLKGKILGCYCKAFACHGDVLAELADNCVHKSAETAQ